MCLYMLSRSWLLTNYIPLSLASSAGPVFVLFFIVTDTLLTHCPMHISQTLSFVQWCEFDWWDSHTVTVRMTVPERWPEDFQRYACATSFLLALEHVVSKHISRKSFMTENTNWQLLALIFCYFCVFLAWYLRIMQLSQSSVTWLLLGPSSMQQGTNDYNDKSLLPATKNVSRCGQQAEAQQLPLPDRRQTSTSLSSRQLNRLAMYIVNT